MIKEMHEIDQVSTNWRAGPAWDYKTIHRSEVSDDPNVVAKFPELLQLHQDVWIAYEVSYHYSYFGPRELTVYLVELSSHWSYHSAYASFELS